MKILFINHSIYSIILILLFNFIIQYLSINPDAQALSLPRRNGVYYLFSTYTTYFTNNLCDIDNDNFSFWTTKIDTDDDINWVKQYIPGLDIWIPIVNDQDNSPINVNTVLYWPDNSEATLRWAPGEPNGLDNLGSPENCIILRVAGWIDVACEALAYIVCTFEPNCFGKNASQVGVCNNGDCANNDYCICFDGYYKSDGVCFLCPNGTWSESGVNDEIESCFPCEEGYQCNNGNKTICPLYYYHTMNTTGYGECIICPEGNYLVLIEEKRYCIQCPPGYYCDTTRTIYSCPEDQYNYKFGQLNCTNCDEGFYITDDNIYCLPCEKDEYCPGNKTRIKCQGIVSEFGCEPCPEGYICIDGIALECPDKFYIEPFYKNCMPCPIGKKCIQGLDPILCENEYYISTEENSECNLCPLNYYTNNTHSGCFPCIDGAKCNGSNLIKCLPNQYILNDICYDCSVGFFCVDSIRIECPPGTYNDEIGLSSCKECELGTFLPFSKSITKLDCINCPSNMTSSYGSPACHYCSEGKYYNNSILNELEKCQLCPPGTYSNINTVSIGCELCPSGYYNPFEGSNICYKCFHGYYSTEGSVECSLCPPGTYTHSNQKYCELCPPGTYNPNYGGNSINDCIKCEKGGNEYGAISVDSCLNCPLGTFNNNNICSPCPPGSYSNEIITDECILCPPGTFNPEYNKSSENDCIPCPPGSFSKEYGRSTTCQLCPAGKFSSIGEVECHPCPSGSYSLENSSLCNFCSPGTYLIDSTTPCIKCNHGSYQELEGQIYCTLCKEGSFNPNIGSNSSFDCIPCPIGTFSSSKGAYNHDFCEPCPQGYVCDTDGLKKPNPCPKGTYSIKNSSISFFDCIYCPKGTYSNFEGLNSIEGCIKCPNGTYNPKEGSSSIDYCIDCPLGTNLMNFPGTSIDDCKLCEPGTFSIKEEGCVKCPLGTYNPNYGVNECIKCDRNEVTLSIGSTKKNDCVKCPLGNYLMNFNCYNCPYGTYLNLSKLQSEESISFDDCIPCGYGYYQPFEGVYNQELCIPCEKGTYGPTLKNQYCIECGKGYYSEVEGGNFFNSCTPCPKGTWSDIEKSDSLSFCNKCLPGTYNNESGSNSIKSCLPCPPNSKNELNGSSNCIECEIGKCKYYGSSFSIAEMDKEWIEIIDPSTFKNLFTTLIPILKVIVSICCLVTLLILLLIIISIIFIISRKSIKYILKVLDLGFSIRNKLNKLPTKNPTPFGGILTILIIIIFISQLIVLTFNFITNNKMVIEKVSLEANEMIRSNFIFESIIVGKHSKCNGFYEVSGFDIESITIEFKFVIEKINESIIEGCKSIVHCNNCLPIGNHHLLSINFDGLIYTSMIFFSTLVSHYIDHSNYKVSGVFISSESLFTGNSNPHLIGLNLIQFRYISISFINSFYEMIGYNPIEKIKEGYTYQLIKKISGSSSNINNFEIQNGVKIEFDIIPDRGIRILQEYIKINFFMFTVQSLSLLSILFIIFNIIFNIYEFIILNIQKFNRRSKVFVDNKLTDIVPTQ